MRTNKFVKKNYVNELLAIIKGNFTENELKKKIPPNCQSCFPITMRKILQMH